MSAVADAVLWPVLDAVRCAAAAQLGATGRPVCGFAIYMAGHPMPADGCDCECDGGGQGTGWVRLVHGATAATSGVTRLNPCEGAALLVSVEVGVHRCGPVADEAGVVCAEAVETYSAGMCCDLTALHRAFLCAPGASDRRWQVTQMQVLGPAGGCAAAVVTAQLPAENCCPVAPTLTWVPDADAVLGAWFTLGGVGEWGATLDFGDGTIPLTVVKPGRLRHTFAAPGTYTVTLTDRSVDTAVATTVVVVTGQVPHAHAFVDASDPWSVLLWLPDPPATRAVVDWGDAGLPAMLTGQQVSGGPDLPLVAHAYPEAGRYRITVTDPDTRRAVTLLVDTGPITLRTAVDEDGVATVTASGLAVGASAEITIGTGGSPVALVVGASGAVTHTPLAALAPGSHPVTVREIVGGVARRTSQRVLVVPDVVDPRLGVVITWGPTSLEPTADPAAEPQTVLVRAFTSRVACVVDWGDGSPVSPLPLAGSAEHEYVPPLPTAGLVVRVSEDPALLGAGQVPWVYSRRLGCARFVGAPMLAARAPGAVDLHIAGIAGLTGLDAYQVAWGDGSDPQDLAAVGDWSVAQHVYALDGTYEITVDGPGMPQPAHRTVHVARVVDAP